MQLVSDSEGACSDFEVISSSSRRVQSGDQGDAGSLLSNSRVSGVLEEINELASKLTDGISSSICSACTISASSSLSSSLIAEGAVMNNPDDSEPWDEVRTIRSNSFIHNSLPRRERRDTDRERRGLRKRSEGEKNEKQRITKKEILVALGTLACSCVIAFSIYLTTTSTNLEELKRLKEDLDELKFVNKLLISSLKDIKQVNTELLNFESKEKELEKSQTILEDLIHLAEEDLPDRYGFDIPFKRCFENILPHEKLCRAIADGLKSGKVFD